MASSPEPSPSIRWLGTLYRALNPRWMQAPLSGEGARRHGGRFNARGRAALYAALDPLIAIAEASQVGQPLQPVTLVSYTADIEPVFAATDPHALAARGIEPEAPSAPDWRLRMADGLAPRREVAEALIAAGYAEMLVPSFARTAQPGARNLVLWDWDGGLRVNDAEGRLR
ncbi:RES domain-containing protein [Paracoccus sp. S-4012]|uniref:RES family NAD+ phosphorylase n=1 Tax=Paracoccus sp. S-4012 TaxID=2665648 RepID=UPI0012AF33BC|nr:RES domain-containing protein [Paracoccus sp. S-4012]MRX49413.1 RES domain-containing protein [Paracoccus sp. S-4012]